MEHIPISEKIEAHKKFYEMRNSEGPLLGFFLNTYYPLKRYKAASKIPDGYFEAADLIVKDFLCDYDKYHALYENIGGELIWTASAFLGVPWVEVILGCKAFADHTTGSCRSIPITKIETVDDINDLDENDAWVKKVKEFVSVISAHSSGRYPVGTTLMRGISDLFYAIYGSPLFIYKFLDQPKEQRKIAEKLASICIKFANIQLNLIPKYHSGVGSLYYNMWMPGRGVVLQEDALALLSPDLFQEFIFPYLCGIIDQFDSSIMHLHPSLYVPVDLLVNTKISAIELHREIGGLTAEDLYSYYKKIINRKPLIIWGDLTFSDLAFIKKKLNTDALAVMPIVTSKKDAEYIWREFKK